MVVETLFAQIPHEAPSASMRATAAPSLLSLPTRSRRDQELP